MMDSSVQVEGMRGTGDTRRRSLVQSITAFCTGCLRDGITGCGGRLGG